MTVPLVDELPPQESLFNGGLGPLSESEIKAVFQMRAANVLSQRHDRPTFILIRFEKGHQFRGHVTWDGRDPT